MDYESFMKGLQVGLALGHTTGEPFFVGQPQVQTAWAWNKGVVFGTTSRGDGKLYGTFMRNAGVGKTFYWFLVPGTGHDSLYFCGLDISDTGYEMPFQCYPGVNDYIGYDGTPYHRTVAGRPASVWEIWPYTQGNPNWWGDYELSAPRFSSMTEGLRAIEDAILRG